MRCFRLLGGVAALCVAAIGAASPTFILTSHLGDHWEYQLANPGASANMFVFDVDLELGVDITNISSPTGWTASFLSGTGHVEWTSSDLPYDLAPDASLGGFAFDAPNAIEQTGGVTSTFWDHEINDVGPIVVGQTTVPGAAVPEPACLCALGLGGLVMMRRRRN